VSAPAPAAFRCYYCEIALSRFQDAETFKPDGKKKAFRVRCVDRLACDLRIARARRDEAVRRAGGNDALATDG
jgi:hypothetical protein